MREAVIRLLHALKRRGVVAGHQEHTPGSFVVELAPVSALWESPRRNRGRGVASPPPTRRRRSTTSTTTRGRCCAISPSARSRGLACKDTAAFLQGEMLKQFGAIAATVGDAPGREARFKRAVRAALDQHE